MQAKRSSRESKDPYSLNRTPAVARRSHDAASRLFSVHLRALLGEGS